MLALMNSYLMLADIYLVFVEIGKGNRHWQQRTDRTRKEVPRLAEEQWHCQEGKDLSLSCVAFWQ